MKGRNESSDSPTKQELLKEVSDIDDLYSHLFYPTDSLNMRYFELKPEVAGELGAKSVFISRYPSAVCYMEYLFDRWPADDIVEAYPCFAVTAALKSAIEQQEYTGVQFKEAEAGRGPNYEFNSRGVALPVIYRLLPLGIAVLDDFSLSPKATLIVSESALDTIRKFRTEDLDVSPCKY